MIKCDICLTRAQDDKVILGEWIVNEDVKVHYFCLLSSQCKQKGKDNEGIFGFRNKDIVASYSSYRDKECHYCEKPSAAVNCSFVGCDRSWHFPCGTLNECLTRFVDKFESYCSRHVPDPNGGKIQRAGICAVCIRPIGHYNPVDSIISSCCLLLHDWDKCFLHKRCVSEYTLNAGYDSICINCSMDGDMTKEKWQHEMRLKGIFIPMREASWEAEGRFKEQVKNKCGNTSCTTPNSTKDVYTCFVCGCFPLHLKCARVRTFDEYNCPRCFDQSFVQRVPKF